MQGAATFSLQLETCDLKLEKLKQESGSPCGDR